MIEPRTIYNYPAGCDCGYSGLCDLEWQREQLKAICPACGRVARSIDYRQHRGIANLAPKEGAPWIGWKRQEKYPHAGRVTSAKMGEIKP